MKLPLFIVDAFTDRPFAGNPAAVCLLDRPREDTWMQLLASEMNLSETAFLLPEAQGYRLRWMTPKVEVELCGHATLASAHFLWETGRLRAEEVARFHTRSGQLLVRQTNGAMEMDFPARPVESCADPGDLLVALNTKAQYLARNGMDYLVEVEDEATLRGLTPDMTRLARVSARGVIVTSASPTTGIDFVSRFFAPASGVAEDPVTGSAHCALGPFWSARLGKNDLYGYQASKRGGLVRVGVRGDRVLLGGKAITVVRGEFVAS